MFTYNAFGKVCKKTLTLVVYGKENWTVRGKKKKFNVCPFMWLKLGIMLIYYLFKLNKLIKTRPSMQQNYKKEFTIYASSFLPLCFCIS